MVQVTNINALTKMLEKTLKIKPVETSFYTECKLNEKLFVTAHFYETTGWQYYLLYAELFVPIHEFLLYW